MRKIRQQEGINHNLNRIQSKSCHHGDTVQQWKRPKFK